jgi:3'(2'), 5'-bisphosphate nucleotidase
MDDEALLVLATGLAERAGAEIRRIRDRGFEVQRKADASVVTEADHAAEAIIVAGLRAALPGCVVVAEEEAAGGAVTAATETFWLVDPLDGTPRRCWAWLGFRRRARCSAVSSGLARGG